MKKFVILILSVILLVSLTACFGNEAEKTNNLRVSFLKVGKADAIILISDNSAVLIDTAEDDDGKEIMTFLKDNGVSELDYLILTHFDKDHVGSAGEIIEGIEVGKVLQSNYPKNSEAYGNYSKALAKKDITPKTVTDEMSFEIDSIRYTIYPPKKDIYAKEESNNSSLVIKVEYGDTSFLLTGDICEERINEILQIDEISCDVIKIPHHGRYKSNLPDLLEKSSPKYAVITCSDKNPEEEETVEAIELLDIRMLVTRAGNITFISNGNTIEVK